MKVYQQANQSSVKGEGWTKENSTKGATNRTELSDTNTSFIKEVNKLP